MIPGCDISSLLDEKLAKWSTTSCALALTRRPFVSKKEEKKSISIEFLYAMKLVPPKDPMKHCSSRHYLLKTLLITTMFIESIGIVHLSIIH